MVPWKLLAPAILASAFAPAAAQDPSELARQIVNDPGAPDVNGAKASLVNDAKVQGG